MGRRFRFVLLTGFLCFCSLISLNDVNAGKITDYSADQFSVSKDGKAEKTGTLISSDDKVKMEMRSPTGAGTLTVIVRKDTKKVYTIMSDKKKYMEKALTDEELKSLMKIPDSSTSVKEMGTEKIQGYLCKKQERTTTMDVMGQTITTKVTAWTADEFDFPLKTVTEDGIGYELRNIKEEKQPAAAFELRSGYTKVNNMMEMME